MKRLSQAVLAIFIALTAACSSIKFDPSHDISGYQTWSWQLTSPDGTPNSVQEELAKELKKSFDGKGYQFTSDPNEADFLVLVTTQAKQVSRSRPSSSPRIVGHYHEDGTYHRSSAKVADQNVRYVYEYDGPSLEFNTKIVYQLNLYQRYVRDPFWSNQITNNHYKLANLVKRLNQFPERNP